MKKFIFTPLMIVLVMMQLHSQQHDLNPGNEHSRESGNEHSRKPGLAPELQWPSYRGYHAGGVLENANLPDSWNLETGENILWKYRIPGLGLSSPVIWGDKLFLTTAVSKTDSGGFKTGLYGNIAIPNWFCL